MPEVDLRILQANERTLLAWIRTGLALMAFGFVLARLVIWLQLEHPDRTNVIATYLGIATLALGTLCHVIGAVRFVAARRAILAGQTIQPASTGPVVVAAAVAAVGAAAIIYLVIDL
jgi:putative membrane protein